MSTPLKPPKKKPRLVAKIIDGSIAGMVGVLATFPLDLAKTRLQNQVVGPDGVRLYTNPFQAVGVVARNEGISGCYSGLSVNFGFISFEKAVKLAANDFFRDIMSDSNGSIAVSSEILAGACAGALQSAVTTPMELLKIKGQEAGSSGKQFNAIASMKKLYAGEGVRGFYRGWCATLVRDVPFSMVYFPTYANLKKVEPFGGGSWWYLTSGMLAGALAGLASTPFDVIKTRIQNSKAKGGGAAPSWMSVCRNTIEVEGGSALFKGGAPRMLCIGSLFAVAQTFYELCIGDAVLNALKL